VRVYIKKTLISDRMHAETLMLRGKGVVSKSVILRVWQ